jgi:hypothetical protein
MLAAKPKGKVPLGRINAHARIILALILQKLVLNTCTGFS